MQGVIMSKENNHKGYYDNDYISIDDNDKWLSSFYILSLLIIIIIYVLEMRVNTLMILIIMIICGHNDVNIDR